MGTSPVRPGGVPSNELPVGSVLILVHDDISLDVILQGEGLCPFYGAPRARLEDLFGGRGK